MKRSNGEERDYVVNVNEDDYVAHVISEFSIGAIFLDRHHIEVARQFEKKVQIEDYGRYVTVKRSFLTFAISFSGERELFFYQPSSFTLSPPRAEITQTNEVHITLRDCGDSERIRQELDQELDNIEQYLVWQRTNIEAWNRELPNLVRTIFRARKAKLLKDSGVVESLGFPLRNRGGPSSYAFRSKKARDHAPNCR